MVSETLKALFWGLKNYLECPNNFQKAIFIKIIQGLFGNYGFSNFLCQFVNVANGLLDIPISYLLCVIGLKPILKLKVKDKLGEFRIN